MRSLIVIAVLYLLVLIVSSAVIHPSETPNVESSEGRYSTFPGENDYTLMGHKLMGLPVSYSINPQGSRGIPENEVISIIGRAFEEWDDQVPVELFDDNPSIIRGPVTEYNRENLVYFIPLSNTSGKAYFTTGYGSPFRVECMFHIKLNRTEPSRENLPPAFNDNEDLLDTALHEVGHVLGLGHPDRTGTRMMATAENLLAPGDILGVKALYGEKTRVHIASDNWSTKVSPLFSTPISARTWLENNGVNYVIIEDFKWPLITQSNWMFELSSGEVQYKST